MYQRIIPQAGEKIQSSVQQRTLVGENAFSILQNSKFVL